ncbi:MAG TPA: alpha/beta fold hydrolase [Verrucomicrobiae bacterium]|nr:alpha/beta fold hydrolase [Verrucomicrobiae bacterium]
MVLCAASIGLMFVTGCISAQGLANRIAKAPNLQYECLSDKDCKKWLRTIFGTNDPCLHLTVPVGPPEATLSVMELPPANYNVEVWGKVTRHKYETNFDLGMKFKTNGIVTPLKQRGTAVLLHGYMMQKETMLPWAVVLAQAGYRVVLVDLRGHGRSMGKTFTAGKYETTDLVQVLDYLTAHGLSDPEVGVLGHSFGADMGLFWAARDPRVKTVVAIAPYDKLDEAIPRFAKELDWPFSTNKLVKAIVLAEPQLGIKWADWTAEGALGKMKVPVLLIGAGKDGICPPADLELMRQAAPVGSEKILIPEANHFVIGFWFQDLRKPVEGWLTEKLGEAE